MLSGKTVILGVLFGTKIVQCFWLLVVDMYGEKRQT